MTKGNQNIIRWALLVPVLALVWFLACCLSFLSLFFMYGFGNDGNDVSFFVILFGLYIVAPFFAAWGIAPKYKKTVGICAVIVIAFFQFLVIHSI